MLGCIFTTLADSIRNLSSLPKADTNMAILIAYYDQCGKAHGTAAFNGLGYALNRNDLIAQFEAICVNDLTSHNCLLLL